ncbi:hypothetical protein HBI80_213750 [Parastagonospora nodorum]|nr:hypothetical protein HBH46_073350 [Parastagonospora nodorum]KAH4895848.1 hypothetical protein HBI80_213750 [Parastagonospora nodorum]KAH5345674.1 hypothetical protein HBI48_199290 [Parastagonospora nodorum]KAH5539810.1 hypothetical protein HBI27_112330 [Parastagonospora nodorum]KAH6131794.1 hypothetical protein HBI64_086550 [Parastagonospora nodorum]
MTSTSADCGIVLAATSDQAMGLTASTTSYPKNITLDIGGRKFKTSIDTLRAESEYFRTQLSDRWTWPREDDGSYFLDADPELFAHLLTFMRRPGTFPLFYNTAKGFDYDLYNKLETEAEYFQVDKLHEWIKNKKYLYAVITNITNAQVRDLDDIFPETHLNNESTEQYIVSRARKVYLCPRRIGCHRGDPNRCGAACAKAQGGEGDEFEDETYVDVVSVKKKVEFVASVCRIE